MLVLRPDNTLRTVGFGASVGYVVTLTVKADDKHRAAMAIADGLVGGNHRNVAANRRRVAETFSEATTAELVGAAKEFDGIIGIIRSEHWLHGAKVLVAKGQNVRPHAK